MAQPTNTQFAMAVHVLTLLAARPGVLVDSGVLATSVASSPVHLRRILGHLRLAGLVDSRPGARGGWRLAQPPESIDLARVWRALNGAEQVLGLHEANPGCPLGQRVQAFLRDLDRQVYAALTGELATMTVADVRGRVTADAGGPVALSTSPAQFASLRT